MIETIRHQDSGKLVVVAKLLTGYLAVTSKIADPESYIKANGLFDAGFVAHVLAWQGNHGLDADGVIGPKTWTAIAQAAPTCSTSKNRTSGPTLAVQILLDTNITCDGIYGPRTKNAVAVFQSSKGLVSDGICGPKTWRAVIVGDSETPVEPVTPGEFKRPIDYKQYDSRWGKKMYSNHGDAKQTMSNSGCGPTAAADVVATLKDSSITPWDLAQMAMAWGDRSYNSGTNWSFFKHLMTEFCFTKMVQSASIDALKACLDAGGYVVCSMGPGYWTSGGHFITAWMYDATYVYCNDPASAKRTKQKISEFMKERKQFFCYYPDAPEPVKKPEPTGEQAEAPAAETSTGADAPPSPEGKAGYRGEKIVDISKYQPNVDYDALLGDTAMVILRAGYRGTLGAVKIDECFKQHAAALRSRGVRFGVYFYSIADTEAKAIEEARKFVNYATEYNPLFYAIDAEQECISAETIAAFADELDRLGVQRAGAYIANHLYDHYRYDDVRDKEDFTWIPRYSWARPKYKCDLWQFTSTGSVAGINGNVDMNVITGDGHDLAWFLGGE